jgi:autotransporter-associated beta strand protein
VPRNESAGTAYRVMSTFRYGVMLLCVFFLYPAGAALAATCDWTGLGTSNRWSDAANWANCNGGTPKNGDSITFQANAAQRVNENDIPGLRVVNIFVQDRGQGNDPLDISGLGITVSTRVFAVKAVGSPGVGTILRLPLALNQPFGEIFVQEAGMTLSITGQLTGPPRVPPAPSPAMFFSGMGTLVLASGQNRWDLVNMFDVTVRVNAAGAWPDEGALVMNRAATLVLNNVNETIGTLSGNSGTIDGPRIQLNGSATLTVQQREDGIFPGTINGTGGLVKNGGATLTLAEPMSGPVPNLYTGTTTVNEGELELFKRGNAFSGPLAIMGGVVRYRADSQLDHQNDVTIDAKGVFDLNGFRNTIGSLSGAGTVQLGTGELAIGSNNRSTTFSGTITGAPRPAGMDALTKTGLGTLTLTGQTGIGGLLRIAAGRLVVNGVLSSNDVRVEAGGTLGGTATLRNAASKVGFSFVSVTGGRIAPGNDLGTVHAEEAAFADGFLDVQLRGLTPGTDYSQLELNSRFQLSPTTRLMVNRGTFAPPRGATFTIVRVNAAVGPIAPAANDGTFQDLPEGATFLVDKQTFRITYRGGDGNDIVLTAVDDAPSTTTYFLSEGATGSFFDEDVALANPQDAAAPVTLTFSKENGEQVVATRTVPARSRLTVHVDDIPGLENTASSVQVRSDRGVPLAVERSMFWDATSYAGHTGGAVSQPSTNWFFAEGSQGFFQTFVLIINPATTATNVTFTFLRENEPAVVKTMTLGAASRLTLHAGDVPELVDRSFGIAISATQPIMAERAMYFGTTPTRLWSGGHESAGVTEASTNWFLAEGATGGFFDTFILMSNPQRTPANVTVRYLLDTGETVTVPKTIPANARLTTNIEAEADTRLHNAAVSTVVTSDVPIIVERSMYWPGAVRPWGEAHNSFGVVSAGTTWGLAEGRVGGLLNFHTFILLANPQTTAAAVQVTFLREGAAPIVQTYTVPPTSRFNIDSSGVPGLKDESFGAVISVTNGVPIIVERSMYWDVNGLAFSGGTNATGISLPSNVP